MRFGLILFRSCCLWVGLLILLAACRDMAVPTVAPTAAVPVPTLAVAAVGPTLAATTGVVPPTFTPHNVTVQQADISGTVNTPIPSPTFTPFPSRTPTPTATPTETLPPTDTPTATPTPSLTSSPTSTPPPNGNYLPNSSFEEEWYHPNGDRELQIPEHWIFEYDEGSNELDPDPWNKWVRPEVRVLSTDFLPPDEWDEFIWSGRQTVKIFKGEGAISYRLLTDVYLDPGTYTFEINIFPDLVEGYTSGGGKIWASDKLSGEIHFIVDEETTNWVLPTFGEKNTLRHSFELTASQTVRLGIAVRGRWAISNNGWFIDDWSLRRVG